jgi:hypothetical protein
MPLERISQSFKDTSLSFQSNPLSRDLVALKNENAISRALRNLVFTQRGERFFDPFYGTNVQKLLFDNLDYITASSIKDEITQAINNYEPRVVLNSVEVNPNYDQNQFDIIVSYRIVGIDVPAQQLSFALLPTR